MINLKKFLLFCWYFLGCIISIPAIVFLIISRWLGIKAENKALRELQKEEIEYDKGKE